MLRTPTLVASLSFVALLMVESSSPVHALQGEPLAIRLWPGGTVSLETHWGLHLVVDSSAAAKDVMEREADQNVLTSERIDHVLSRRPNETEATWIPSETWKANAKSEERENALQVESVLLANGKVGGLFVEVDGVRILFTSAQAGTNSVPSEVQRLQGVDLLVLSVSGELNLAASTVKHWLKSVEPNRVMLRAGTPEQSNLDSLIETLAQTLSIQRVDHNTMALSAPSPRHDTPLLMSLTDQPWRLTGELKDLFNKMQQSNLRSQKVFEPLSVAQMNFQPANGTHTPRWNTEHMMGRQLQFFSQIYHEQDASIPVMDLNPKQMPKDYRFAHSDWTGREEARQMQRVSDFCRRFAYLLDGLKVDERAPGSRWPTLRALLVQMDRHYDQHTGNTVKKFSLPGWPES